MACRPPLPGATCTSGKSLTPSSEHEALFRRIAVERARAQVALDEDLQRRLVNAVAWDGDRFDGYFLSGVLSLEVELPPDAEEDDNG